MQNQREEALEPPGLACNGLTLGYDGRPVIEGLDLSLPPGASLAIVGESGCGKSTLLTALAGLRPSISGTVRWTSPQGGVRSIQDMRTSFVWQHLGLFPWKRVRENLALPLELSAGRCADSAGRVSAMLSELRLSGLESRFPSELSGGQRQRLALGRALIVQPQVLFMDEPFSALDALLRARMQDILTALRRRHPCSVILVTHDIGEAVALGSHVLMLAPHGRRAPECFENPAYSQELGCGDRASPAFYDTVRRIHAGALALGPDLLPDPVATIRLFAESLSTPEFWGHILVSLWRLTLGLVAAVAVAFPLGLLLGHCRAADLAGSPLLFITYPLPKIVLLPVFFTLVGLGDASRVLLIALTTGYQVLVIIRAGALSIDPSWVKAFRSMGGTTAEAVRHLYVPAALPALFTSLKVASGTAVAVLFLAESFATTSGLGYLIMDAWGMGDVLFMFNAILGMSLLGLVIYGVIGLLERVCCPWLFAGRK